MKRSRVVLGLPLLSWLVASCTSGAIGPTVPSGTAGGVYRDPAGWSIQVEPGWRVVPFHISAHGVRAAGAEISKVPLPNPIAEPGTPIQAGGLTLPAGGIALVIGTDVDSKLVRQVPLVTPPLAWPHGWIEGSCPSASPCLDAIWFHARPGGAVLIATLKIGSDAWHERGDLAAVKRMVGSLSFSWTGLSLSSRVAPVLPRRLAAFLLLGTMLAASCARSAPQVPVSQSSPAAKHQSRTPAVRARQGLENALGPCFLEGESLVPGGLERGPLMGDVDGDGTTDRVIVFARRTSIRPCRYFLSIRTSQGRFTTQLPAPSPSDGSAVSDYQVFLAPAGMIHLPGIAGRLIYVQQGHGATGSHGSLYMVRGSAVRRLAFEGERWRARYSGNLWFTASADFGDGADCVAGSPRTMVESRYWLRGHTNSFNLVREFFRLVDRRFVSIHRRRLVVPYAQLHRFPEFGGEQPLEHCPGRIGLNV